MSVQRKGGARSLDGYDDLVRQYRRVTYDDGGTSDPADAYDIEDAATLEVAGGLDKRTAAELVWAHCKVFLGWDIPGGSGSSTLPGEFNGAYVLSDDPETRFFDVPDFNTRDDVGQPLNETEGTIGSATEIDQTGGTGPLVWGYSQYLAPFEDDAAGQAAGGSAGWESEMTVHFRDIGEGQGPVYDYKDNLHEHMDLAVSNGGGNTVFVTAMLELVWNTFEVEDRRY